MAGTTSQTESEDSDIENNSNISLNNSYNPFINKILLFFKQDAFDMRWLLLLFLCVFLPNLLPTKGHHLTASLSNLNMLEENTDSKVECLKQENYVLYEENCIEVLPIASCISAAVEKLNAEGFITINGEHILAEVCMDQVLETKPFMQKEDTVLTTRIINFPISSKVNAPVANKQSSAQPQEVISEIISTISKEIKTEQAERKINAIATPATQLTSLIAGKTSNEVKSEIATLPKTKLVIKKAQKKEVKVAKKKINALQNLQKESYTQGKMYFLVFGAKWCTPCKIMEETAFRDEYVKDFIKAHYLKMKVDIDSVEGKSLKSKYQVKSIPTILIFNEDGKEVARVEEGLPGSKLLRVLQQYNAVHYHSMTLNKLKREQHQAGVKNIVADFESIK